MSEKGVAQALEDGSIAVVRESTLQTAIDLDNANETLARIADIVRLSGSEPVKFRLLTLLEQRHPWLFTDASSLTPNTARPQISDGVCAPPNGSIKVRTDL